MNRALHEAASDVFEAVFDLSPAERDSAIAERCRDRPDVEAEVRRLIELSETQDALSDAAIDSGVQFTPGMLGPGVDSPDAQPLEVDGFTIIRRIGEGGMGVVYEAEQDHPRRRVAVKLIKPGFVTPSLLRRIRFEADVLGRLRHPGIAQIYATGSVSRFGVTQPYLAMELVEGAPLRSAARALPLRAKVELIARIADAVHHAHQKGVIHRDLKPDNVLVVPGDPTGTGADRTSGAVGQPKVLDFGIARAVEADPAMTAAHTDAGQVLGTVSYMSPEQINGSADIDVRTDVYALGVIAYELLGGRLPHDLSGMPIAQAARTVSENDAPRLGTSSGVLRGDVETIVAKASDREPSRRYQSAAELSADLRRYLASEPITARPASVVYQASRFAARNRGLVAGLGVAVVVLVLGAAGTVWYAVQAQRASDTATARADELELVATFQQRMLADIDPYTLGLDLRARLSEASAPENSAETAAEFLAKIDTTDIAVSLLERQVLMPASETIAADDAQSPSVRARLERSIATVYADWARPEAARDAWQRVLDLARANYGENHPLTIDALGGLSAAHRQLAEFDRALELASSAHESALRSFGPNAIATVRATLDLAASHAALGGYDRAESLARDAYGRAQQLKGEDPALPYDAGVVLADTLVSNDRATDADALLVSLVGRAEEEYGGDHRIVLRLLTVLGLARAAAFDYDGAIPLLQRVERTRASTLGQAHTQTTAARQYLGQALREAGRIDDAARVLELALAQSEASRGIDHVATVNILNDVASLYQDQGRLDEALALSERAIESKRRTVGVDHPHTLIAANNLGMLYADAGRWEDAAAILTDTYERRSDVLGNEHTFTLFSGFHASRAELNTGDTEAASDIVGRVVSHAVDALGPEHAFTALFRAQRGATMLAIGDSEPAERDLLEAEAVLRGSSDVPRHYYHSCVEALVSLYTMRGDDDTAEHWRARLTPPDSP